MVKTYHAAVVLLMLVEGTLRWIPTPATEKVPVRTFEHNITVSSIALSPGGKTLAVGGTRVKDNEWHSEVQLWNVQTGQLRRNLSVPNGVVQEVVFSSNGKILAVGGGTVEEKNGQLIAHDEVLLFDAQTGKLKRTLTEHRNYVHAITFSPNSKILASESYVLKGDISTGGEVKLWDVESGRLLRTLPMPKMGASVAFSPDGQTLANGNWDGELKLWDVRTGKLKHTLSAPLPHFSLDSVAFSPDGKMIAGGGAIEVGDRKKVRRGVVILWNTRTRTVHRILEGHNNRVYLAAFFSDGKTLVVFGATEISLPYTGADVQELPPDAMDRLKTNQGVVVTRVLKYTPAGNAGVTEGDVIQKINGKEVSRPEELEAEVRKHTLGDRLTFSIVRDGKQMELRTIVLEKSETVGQSVELWDVQKGVLRRTLAKREGSIKPVAFSPNGDFWADGDRDGKVKLWRIE